MTGDANGFTSEISDMADLRVFVQHVALSLSVHRGIRPAVVWPRTEPQKLLGFLSAAAAHVLPGRVIPAGAEVAPLTSRFSDSLRCTTSAGYLRLLARRPDWRPDVGDDLLLMSLQGGYRARIQAPTDPEATGLSLWLHPAEFLYVPDASRLSLVAEPSEALLLVLFLGATHSDPPD
jgi:hypothetical protein